MTLSDHNARDFDQWLDLLVDGELSDPQRRELLGRLDQMPDGWRRCALAFLEAQCWKRDLGAIARESLPAPQTAPAPQTRPAAVPRACGVRWRTILAAAAGLLIVLAVGLLLRDVWSRPGLDPGPGPGDVAGVLPESASGVAAAKTPRGTPDRGPQVASPWQMVTLAGSGTAGGTGRSIRLPAVEREGIDDAWLRSFPAAIPAEVLRALQNTGHEVRQSRDLLRLPMRDGRGLVVPLDQVELDYVGGPLY